MKRYASSTITALAVLTAILVAAPVAGATTPTRETIVLVRDSSGTPIGWSASGTFTDSGSWIDPFAVVGGALPQTPVFEVEINTVQTGASGAFQMDFQGHFNVLQDTGFGGTWVIRQGTGAYATLSGQGTWTRTSDPISGNRIITCQGLVHFS